MKIVLSVDCNCNNTHNKKKVITKQYHMEDTVEVWVRCDCGSEEFLFDEGDMIE